MNFNKQMTPIHNDKQGTSFADLLERYEPEPLKQGQYVQGSILQIKDNVILVDVGAKRTAVVPPQDIIRLNEEDLEKLSVGDEVTLYVLRTPKGGEDLLTSLNKGLEKQDWVRAKVHQENKDLLELKVIGHNKGGLTVSFGHLHGFVPTSHIPELKHVRSQRKLTSLKAKRIDTLLSVKVIEADRKRRRLVFSATEALSEIRKLRLLELLLHEGQSMTGRITNLVKFGAFVDLGGIEGLIHISEIDWQHVKNPAEFLTPGEEVEVLIQSVNVEKERIQLSRKALLPSPWEQFAETHANGSLIDGIVTNVTNFGAFVLVAKGIEGLIHISEMRGTQNQTPQDVLSPGDTVLTRILNIDVERQRLSLSQRRISTNEETEWLWQRQNPTLGFDEEE